MQAESAEAICEYHADNELPLAAFIALQTQWRILAGAAGAVYLGLEYASIPVVARSLGITTTKAQSDLFVALRIMERAALPLLNARDDD